MRFISLPVIVIVIALVIIFSFAQKKYSQTSSYPTVTIRNHIFSVEIANTTEKRARGLSGRESLGEGEGMLFLFEAPAMLSFWMKDMYFPIDILFIRDGKVITIHKNVPPPTLGLFQNQLPRYLPREPANMVLEISSGLSEKYGFQEGDEIIIKGL